jgi:hypothetical protein
MTIIHFFFVGPSRLVAWEVAVFTVLQVFQPSLQRSNWRDSKSVNNA